MAANSSARGRSLPARLQAFSAASSSASNSAAAILLDDMWLNRADAANFLGFSIRYREKLSRTGDGPPYSKFGSAHTAPVRYQIGKLKAWLADLERRSTSDAGAERAA